MKVTIPPDKFLSGNPDLDEFLQGGYDTDIITTLYGPSGSGKTTLCILAAIQAISTGKKVIYIDTEASFSVERFKQIAGAHFETLLKSFYFLRPVNFSEQHKAFDKLRDLINDSIGVIIIDTISMLYRLEMGQTREVYDVNKKLGMQLSYLSEISRKSRIPVIITNQVYSSFDDKNKVNIVGGDILKYSSKTLVELQCFHNGIRKAIMRKSRSIAEEKEFIFQLVEEGIKKIEVIPRQQSPQP